MLLAGSWKRFGLAMLGVALLVATTGCAQQAVKSDEAVSSAGGAGAGAGVRRNSPIGIRSHRHVLRVRPGGRQ